MTVLDLTLLPLYRLNNQELTALPGLMAMTAPRKAARGREHDRLIVYLVLTGNATLSTAEYLQLTTQTASTFFDTSGSLTAAMRTATNALNNLLLERNLGSSGRGQYAVGWLTLAALRDEKCTILQSGPSHVFWLGQEQMRHVHEPALSGKGLGLGQAVNFYLSQYDLQPGDRLILAGKPPEEWTRSLTEDYRPISIESIRRRLFSLARGDLNAVLVQAQEGMGNLTILRPAPAAASSHTQTESLPPSKQPQSASETAPSTMEAETPAGPEEEPEPQFQPSAYAIPPQPPAKEEFPSLDENLVEQYAAAMSGTESTEPEPPPLVEIDEPFMSEEEEPVAPREPSEATRQMARGLVGGMQAWRRMTEALGRNLRHFLPNLLPSGESSEPAAPASTAFMIFIAVAVPLLVVTVASVAYFRFGQSEQYDNYFAQAQMARAKAVNATDPARQRDEWQAVLLSVNLAEEYRQTPESQALKEEAQTHLDSLLGIQRLLFYPAFGSGINVQISRLAGTETDLYLLDAESGRILHANQTGRGFQIDNAFRCEPGDYGGYLVNPLVDILTLPRLNTLNAAVVGVDASGNLLYCSPGQVPQAIPLPVPDTNWGRVTGFTLDSGNLYVLDAQSRAIWVYVGKDGSFLDRPYFFFGGQIPEIEDATDIAVNGDDLYLLHGDGHLSTCSYSRIETVPTRCQDPAEIAIPFPAYQGMDLTTQAHFTQMLLAAPPDSTLLLLDSDSRAVFRISPRSLELLNQIRPAPNPGSPMRQGSAGAIAFGTNHILFIAVEDQVYFTSEVP